MGSTISRRHFCDAIMNEDIREIKRILGNNEQIEHMDGEETLLHFAVRNRKAEILDMLLSHIKLLPDIDAISGCGQKLTALQIACYQGDAASVRVLLKHNAKLYVRHPNTVSPLHSIDISIRAIVINHGVLHCRRSYMGCFDSYWTSRLFCFETDAFEALLEAILLDLKEYHMTKYVSGVADVHTRFFGTDISDGEGLVGLLLHDLSQLCIGTKEIVMWLEHNYEFLASLHNCPELLTALLELSMRISCKSSITWLVSKNARMSATGPCCQFDRQRTFNVGQKLEGLLFFFSHNIDMWENVINTKFTLKSNTFDNGDAVVLLALIKAGGLHRIVVWNEQHLAYRTPSELFYIFCVSGFWELAGLMYCDGHTLGDCESLIANNIEDDQSDRLMDYANCALANKTTDNSILPCIRQMRIQPRTLQNVCVIAIRRALHNSILYSVNELDLPHRLRNQIVLDFL